MLLQHLLSRLVMMVREGDLLGETGKLRLTYKHRSVLLVDLNLLLLWRVVFEVDLTIEGAVILRLQAIHTMVYEVMMGYLLLLTSLRGCR